MNIEFKILKPTDDLSKCYDIRKVVFVDEQKYDINLDIDEIDSYAEHILMLIDKKPVATARYYKKNGEWFIGRICILIEYRKLGLGVKILQFVESQIKKTDADMIVLTAQCRAKGFYEKLGYIEEGDIVYEEGQPHIRMTKDI